MPLKIDIVILKRYMEALDEKSVLKKNNMIICCIEINYYTSFIFIIDIVFYSDY